MILLLCILKKLLFLLEIINLYLELKFRAIGIGIQQFEQISLWAFVFLSDCLVLLSKKKLGKSLWANVHGQISFAQRTLNRFSSAFHHGRRVRHVLAFRTRL